MIEIAAACFSVLCYSNTDVHTVASLLKLYLRELPEPVIPFSKYEDFLNCAQLLSKDEEEVRRFLHCMSLHVFVCQKLSNMSLSGDPGAWKAG